MKTVGIRELKNRLSEYLRQVRSGEDVLVTDRGEVVAELIVPGLARSGSAASAPLVELARRGQVTLGAANSPAVYPPLAPLAASRLASGLLDEERGSR
jgi:antitoxin (DNA-binding transcriptional repressor) of toxin-antitoxin stability system